MSTLKKLTRAEAHKAMDDGNVITAVGVRMNAWRDDTHECGPYVAQRIGCAVERLSRGWEIEWSIEIEEPWRPVEGEAVYVRDNIKQEWRLSIFSHIKHYENNDHSLVVCNGAYEIIAPVKGNEGSAGTTKELKNTLTSEDLK